VLDTLAQLAGAIVIAFVAIALVRSALRGTIAWLVRLVVAGALLVASLWIVYRAIPNAAALGTETLSIVATLVLLAGLAADELIGADLRRMLGI
jgi:hypothetical protein